MAIKKAIYHVDNGTDFDEIHFKTSADQVYMSDGASVQTKISNGQIYKLTKDTGRVKDYANGDLNNLKQTGFYKICGNVSNKPGNPSSWFFVEVLEAELNGVYQKAVNDTNGETYVRVFFNGAWTEWKSVSFGGQQHTLTEDNGYCKKLENINLNDVHVTGFYTARKNVSNKPANIGAWCFVEVFDSGYGRVIQKVYDDTAAEFYIRLNIDGTWGNWKQFYSYSTLSEVENKISILESENKELREELTQIQTSIASLTSLIAVTLEEK